jgi:hypothetical protein
MFEIVSESFVSFHAKCPLFLAHFNKIGICSKIFAQLSNIILYENPFSSWTDGNTDGQKDVRTEKF